MLEQNRTIDPSAPVGDFSTVAMAEPAHDAQLAGMMSLDPKVLGEPDHRAPVDLVMKHTFDDDGELVSSEVVTPAYSGPSPILVRRDSRQAWAQAKPLDVLKDMAPERLADWVDGMNEVAGFAKYKVA
ncbi:hypothetical protein SEA_DICKRICHARDS_38 [Microbacterium phage DickRichards]|uniref:hypothetical protein n=1 Tax=Microbacterium phage DickRichards TaxID=2776866 RepID=UPI0018A63220|nr:hypothetical protein QDW35_gp38 [Microbacterium phage DickRichards]QOP66355.1 hypothetical protein SEA_DICKRICHARDS_38 [Microbacterium phage DickRichards]